MERWIIKQPNINLDLMTKILKIDTDLAKLLANRNIRTKNQAIKFLNPLEKFMYDTNLMKDINKATEIILNAIARKDKIMIYGDYDVDGVMSTVILHKTLSVLGANVCFHLPSRHDDGFGLNKNIIKKLSDNGTKLIITCDNGIAAHEEIKLAKNLNMQVIIIDHHFPNTNPDDCSDVLPCADATVDCKQQSCCYPFKMLCAAGMAYKVYSKILSNNILNVKHKNNFYLKNDLLIFAAIGTLCDVVDLTDENRIIAKQGIDLINNKKFINKGLTELLKINGIYDKKICAEDIGFIIGPCINACGRLKTADLAAKLFLSEDINETKNIAREIVGLNSKRKVMTKNTCDKILAELESSYNFNKYPIIVYYSKDIDESIAGIIAGRIKEKYFHPVIIFTDSNQENIIKGSARSIENYDIFNALQKHKDLFIKFGGHKLAAGLSMERKNLMTLREKLNSECKLSENGFIEKIEIDFELDFRKINFDLLKKINLLGPFGHSNQKPLFVSRQVKINKIKTIREKNTLIFKLEQNKKIIKAISFGLYDNFCEQINNRFDSYMRTKILNGYLNNIDLFMDIVYSLEANEFNDKVYLQLRIKDFKLLGDF